MNLKLLAILNSHNIVISSREELFLLISGEAILAIRTVTLSKENLNSCCYIPVEISVENQTLWYCDTVQRGEHQIKASCIDLTWLVKLKLVIFRTLMDRNWVSICC